MAQLINETKLDFKDILIMPKRSELSSRSQVNLERTFKFKHGTSVEYTGVPLIVANMDHTGTFEMAEALSTYKATTALHKFYTIEQLIEYFNKKNRNPYTFYSMGITKEDTEKFEQVMTYCNPFERRPSFVCVDVANGYSRRFVSFVEQLRERYQDKIVIMAGNVVTPDMTYDLLERGADIVKIGTGSGSVCTTRKITGVGYPQLSAIMECADAAHGAGGLICGDGGVQSAGDLAKAFAGGADFVMCGGIFAGYAECSGDLIGNLFADELFEFETQQRADPLYGTLIEHIRTHIPTKEKCRTVVSLATDNIIHKDPIPVAFFKGDASMKFRGMSSKEAMDQHYGGKASYRAAEGKEVIVPYKGPVAPLMEELLGGVRSACTYVGANQLKHFSKCATFVKVNRILNDLYGEAK